MHYNYNLKEARLAAGFTQKELAAAVDIPQPRICEMEKNRRGISLELGVKLSLVLGVSTYELLYGDQEPDLKKKK